MLAELMNNLKFFKWKKSENKKLNKLKVDSYNYILK